MLKQDSLTFELVAKTATQLAQAQTQVHNAFKEMAAYEQEEKAYSTKAPTEAGGSPARPAQ
jgi:hypothetical protein